MDKEIPQVPQNSIDLKPEVAKGTYSNLAIIAHSHSEFVIDFATMLPGLPRPEVNSRIVLAPEHAKRLLEALKDNVAKYESMFGEIKLAMPAPQRKESTFDLGSLSDFGGNGTKS